MKKLGCQNSIVRTCRFSLVFGPSTVTVTIGWINWWIRFPCSYPSRQSISLVTTTILCAHSGEEKIKSFHLTFSATWIHVYWCWYRRTLHSTSQLLSFLVFCESLKLIAGRHLFPFHPEIIKPFSLFGVKNDDVLQLAYKLRALGSRRLSSPPPITCTYSG